jgi:hypothetical protein
VSFALQAHEAAFLRDQITTRCAGSLLAWFATHGEKPGDGAFWDEPSVMEAPQETREVVELARRFSLHMEGAPLLYNLMLAELRHERHEREDDAERMDSYRTQLTEWAAAENAEHPFDPLVLWSFMATQGHRLISPQKSFVEGWTQRVTDLGADNIADDPMARARVRSRELALKTGRSRFTNEGRLLDWSGRTGVGRLDFRWHRVRYLLADLHQGLVA